MHANVFSNAVSTFFKRYTCYEGNGCAKQKNACNLSVTSFVLLCLLVFLRFRSHMPVPKVNKRYMAKEIDEVSCVLIVFTAWGTNDNVVQNAAIRPEIVMLFIITYFKM